jgi:hypothetical protein
MQFSSDPSFLVLIARFAEHELQRLHARPEKFRVALLRLEIK